MLDILGRTDWGGRLPQAADSNLIKLWEEKPVITPGSSQQHRGCTHWRYNPHYSFYSENSVPLAPTVLRLSLRKGNPVENLVKKAQNAFQLYWCGPVGSKSPKLMCLVCTSLLSTLIPVRSRPFKGLVPNYIQFYIKPENPSAEDVTVNTQEQLRRAIFTGKCTVSAPDTSVLYVINGCWPNK